MLVCKFEHFVLHQNVLRVFLRQVFARILALVTNLDTVSPVVCLLGGVFVRNFLNTLTGVNVVLVNTVTSEKVVIVSISTWS